MAQKKDFKFPQDLMELSRFHFALSHPARLQILGRLKQATHASFAELASNIPLHPSTTSQHITILQRSNLLLPAELADGTTGYKINFDVYTYAKELMEIPLQRVVEDAHLT
ncbi:MAG: helix-turn-helix domain-containing protein [Bacteroidota bacterium]